MNTRETILATGICEHSIYHALKNGQLSGKRIGRRWEIPAHDVMEWAEECWESKRYLMYPPDRIADNIAEFTAR